MNNIVDTSVSNQERGIQGRAAIKLFFYSFSARRPDRESHFLVVTVSTNIVTYRTWLHTVVGLVGRLLSTYIFDSD